MNNDTEKSMDFVANVDDADIEATETTKTAVYDLEGIRETDNIVSISVWPPTELSRYPDIANCVLNLTRRFFPSHDLIEFIATELVREGLAEESATRSAVVAWEKAKLFLRDRDEGNQWALRLQYIFNDEYPVESREVWCDGRISSILYERIPTTSDVPYSFQAKQVEPISSPKELLCTNIAPELFHVEIKNGKPIVKATPEVERFENGDKKAVPRSCLREEVIFGRPTYGIEPGWVKYDEERLPRKIHTVQLLCSRSDQRAVDEFIRDLQSTFAWPESKGKKSSHIATYLSYLIQPIVAHLSRGQMPAYAFMGPTKSGKGALSNGIPEFIYNRPGHPTVMSKKIPKETYEFEVLMNTGKHALFLCFDEVKNATDEELKQIDAFCTQTDIQVRKFRMGYYQLPNLYTVSLTAVHRTFSDETYGRLAVIQLKESRPEMIAEFFKKWRRRGPELLSALVERVNTVQIDLLNLPSVPDRRPGFGLMSYVVEKAFDVTPDFAIETVSNDILDDLCRMHEAGSNPKNAKSNWFRYSPRAFQQFMADTYDLKYKKANAIAAVNTALGYTSTRSHPTYKLMGYPAESGRHYHIEIREEGNSNKRTFIYIQEVGSQIAGQMFKTDNFEVQQ